MWKEVEAGQLGNPEKRSEEGMTWSSSGHCGIAGAVTLLQEYPLAQTERVE